MPIFLLYFSVCPTPRHVSKARGRSLAREGGEQRCATDFQTAVAGTTMLSRDLGDSSAGPGIYFSLRRFVLVRTPSYLLSLQVCALWRERRCVVLWVNKRRRYGTVASRVELVIVAHRGSRPLKQLIFCHRSRPCTPPAVALHRDRNNRGLYVVTSQVAVSPPWPASLARAWLGVYAASSPACGVVGRASLPFPVYTVRVVCLERVVVATAC